MASKSTPVSSSRPVTYSLFPALPPIPLKTAARKEAESVTPSPTANNDLGQPNIDGTGATFSIFV